MVARFEEMHGIGDPSNAFSRDSPLMKSLTALNGERRLNKQRSCSKGTNFTSIACMYGLQRVTRSEVQYSRSPSLSLVVGQLDV